MPVCPSLFILSSFVLYLLFPCSFFFFVYSMLYSTTNRQLLVSRLFYLFNREPAFVPYVSCCVYALFVYGRRVVCPCECVTITLAGWHFEFYRRRDTLLCTTWWLYRIRPPRWWGTWKFAAVLTIVVLLQKVYGSMLIISSSLIIFRMTSASTRYIQQFSLLCWLILGIINQLLFDLKSNSYLNILQN